MTGLRGLLLTLTLCLLPLWSKAAADSSSSCAQMTCESNRAPASINACKQLWSIEDALAAEPEQTRFDGEGHRLYPSQTRYSVLYPLLGRKRAEVEERLLKQNFTKVKNLPGTNRPVLVRLDDGTLAVWKPHQEAWHSNYRAEVLAYELDQLLGFGLVPPTVERDIGGVVGSLQLFREGVGRRARAPNSRSLNKQKAFDWLIDGRDRYAVNYLVDKDGEVISIDNGTSFTGYGTHDTTFPPAEFLSTSEGRAIIARLRRVKDRPEFARELEVYLGHEHAERFLRRADSLVLYFDRDFRPMAEPASSR